MKSFFTRPRLIFTAILVFVGLASYGLYHFLWFGTLKLSGLDAYETIVVNGKSYATKTIDSSLKLRPGSYTLEAFGTRQNPYKFDSSVNPFSESTHTLISEPVSDENFLSFIANATIPENYTLSGGSIFEDGYWAVGLIAPIDGNSEGWVDIFRFNGMAWELVESGTGFDTAYLSSRDYPLSIQRYLGGNNE